MFDFDKIEYTKQDENSSSFVIDLKKKQKIEENIPDKKKTYQDFLEKLFEHSLGDSFLKFKKLATEKAGLCFSKILEKTKKILSFSGFVFSFYLLRFLGRFFYKIFFKIGWIVLFLIRFVYFFHIALLGKVINLFAWPIKLYRYLFLSRPWTSIKEKPKKISVEKIISENIHPGDEPYKNKLKSIIVFVSVLAIIILPFKAFSYYKKIEKTRGQVLGVSEKAIDSFLNAAGAMSDMNFSQAENEFNFANDNFSRAKKELSEINGLVISLSSIYPDENIRMAANGKAILAIGQLVSELGKDLSGTLDNLLNKNSANPVAVIDTLVINGEKMFETLNLLNEEINKIDTDNLPDNYKEQFISLKNKSASLAGGIKEFIELTKGIRILLGADYDKRYLLVFQNNAELRATGGFIGSFALIDFREGKIKNIEAPGGGSYDTEAGLKTLVAAPAPLQLVNPLWHFWDANWWPDWPTSANKLMWFYEKSDGPTVDGVISLTPDVLEKILEITGPIDMSEKYGVILDHDNFWMTVQEFSEQKQDITLEPKKIIGDMAAKLIEELPKRLNKDILLQLIGALGEKLDQKQIMFYFTDNNLQENMDNYGWSGRQKQTFRDYLSVINTNIAGGKSDKKIKEEINHEARIMQNGSVINTIEIKRIHTGIKNEKFIGVRNVNWIRVYVPLGSELLEASGFARPDAVYFDDPDPSWEKDPLVEKVEQTKKIDKNSGTEIYEENGYTVFANWSMVDPGETTIIRLRYKLPFKMQYKLSNSSNSMVNFLRKKEYFDYYSLFVQKQPGSLPSVFVSNLIVPESTSINWSYLGNENILNNGWKLGCDLVSDKYWAVILKKI